jgi:hypothetical protein
MADNGFDINKIKIKESDKVKALTGEYTFGLPPASKTEPNAEVEDNEYIKYPDETVVQAKGVRHERGGIKVNLPDETEILSDTLKLTAKQARDIRDKYNVEVSIRDTYSSALEKYTKRLGLKRLNDDQEEVFKIIKKQQENKTIKNPTLALNNEYLSTKVYDIEQKKKPLEEKRKKLFDLLFEQQESTKKPDSKDTTQMRLGGEFEKFASKHGFSVEEASRILAREGKTIPIYENGAKKRRKIVKQTITDDEFNKVDANGTSLSDKWNGDKIAYEEFLTAKKGILDNKDLRSSMYKNYQSVIESDEAYTGKNKKLKEGYSKPLKSLTEDQVLEQLLAQEERNARLSAHKLDAKTTEQNVAKGQTTNQTTLDKIKATKGLADLDFSKGYQGQAAYIAYNKTMQQDPKFKDWASINQTGKDDETIFGLKGTISGIDNYNTNTTLGERLGYLGEAIPDCPCGEDANGECLPCKKDEPKKEENPPKEGPIEDNTVIPRQKQNQQFFVPERFVLPPSPQSPETMVQNRFSRLDPIRVGIEDDLASSAANRQFGASQLKDLPAAQRVAGLQQMLATTGGIENKAILDKNRINAENQATTDQYNAGQRDRENIALGSNLLNFEGRSLTGKDKTENNLRNYINFRENESMNNFGVQQRFNTLNKLFPDYSIDAFGMGTDFDPSTNNQVQNNDNVQGIVNASNQTSSNYYPNDNTEEEEEKRLGGRFWRYEEDEDDDDDDY